MQKGNRKTLAHFKILSIKIINTLLTGQINEFIFVFVQIGSTPATNTVSFKQQKKTFTSYYFLMQKDKKKNTKYKITTTI